MSLNGTGVLPRLGRVIELGDLTPETVGVAVIRDGERVMLTAYVNGDRALLQRARDFANVRTGYYAALEEAGEDIDEETRMLYWLSYQSSSLRAVIPEMTEEESTLLAFNGRAVTLLQDLGWWVKPGEDTPEGEAPSGESLTTGATSLQTSATITSAVEPI